MVFIDIVGPDGSRTVAVPTADVTIGSGPDNDIQLVHADVANRHSLVIERGGHAIVLDTSGLATVVNNHAITEATILSSFCQVGIGPFRLRFRHVDLPPDTVQTITQRLHERPLPPPPTTKRTGEIQVPVYPSEPKISSSAPTPRSISEVKFEAYLNATSSAQQESEYRGPETQPSIVRGLLVASNDPVELEFIRSILEDDDPQDARLVYADWLEQRGDETRAQYMRLVNELASHVNASYIEQARLRDAGKNLGVPWRATVAPRWLPIEQCPRKAEDDQTILDLLPPSQRQVDDHHHQDDDTILRLCPKTWGRVGRGSVDDLRRCATCTRYVKYVTSIEEGVKAVAQGTPVVVDGSVMRTSSSDLDPPRTYYPYVVVGRRPAGAIAGEATACDGGVGEFFAAAAALESLSVTAFEWLALDLAELGAPLDLQERAFEAACEETRHTRAMSAFASAHGSVVTYSSPMTTRPTRDALAIAIENAVEGCVRETFGACIAEWQAEHAESLDVRSALTVIALEEESHASLARDVAAWLEPRLTEDERARVAAERSKARATLIDELTSGPELSEETRRISGHPSREEALRIAGVC
jgi:uncharacterized protein (TIGR02996 family)